MKAPAASYAQAELYRRIAHEIVMLRLLGEVYRELQYSTRLHQPVVEEVCFESVLNY